LSGFIIKTRAFFSRSPIIERGKAGDSKCHRENRHSSGESDVMLDGRAVGDLVTKMQKALTKGYKIL
jgi:hypothetical protein